MLAQTEKQLEILKKMADERNVVLDKLLKELQRMHSVLNKAKEVKEEVKMQVNLDSKAQVMKAENMISKVYKSPITLKIFFCSSLSFGSNRSRLARSCLRRVPSTSSFTGSSQTGLSRKWQTIRSSGETSSSTESKRSSEKG